MFCSYICAHTFGRRMVYPGTAALIQMLVGKCMTYFPEVSLANLRVDLNHFNLIGDVMAAL